VTSQVIFKYQLFYIVMRRLLSPVRDLILLLFLLIYLYFSCKRGFLSMLDFIAIVETFSIIFGLKQVTKKASSVRVDKHLIKCHPGEELTLLVRVDSEEKLEERNFEVFIDGNRVSMRRFRSIGREYEICIIAPEEAGSHSAMVKAGNGEGSFDCLEIMVSSSKLKK